MWGMQRFALVAVVAILAVACGEEGRPSGAGAAGSEVESPDTDIPCDPVTTNVKLVAFESEAGKPPSFDKACIAVPAGEPFTVRLRNEDFLEHNFAVFADEDATELVYRGERFRGPKETVEYEVPAIEPAGTYVFLCDVHRTLMTGRLLVQ